MPPYGLSLTQAARAILNSLGRNDQIRLRQAFTALQTDPARDGITKRAYPIPPAVVSVYDTAQWWIVYDVMGRTVRVLNIIRMD